MPCSIYLKLRDEKQPPCNYNSGVDMTVSCLGIDCQFFYWSCLVFFFVLFFLQLVGRWGCHWAGHVSLRYFSRWPFSM